jgi:creatinine amidohydrolase
MEDTVNLYELTSPDAGQLLQRARIGVLSVGATEQHGPHLPMGADTIGVWGLAKRLAARRPLVLAPPLPFGNSEYHLAWPDTLTLRHETLVATVVDLASSFRHHGLRNVLLLNGHGGNRVAVDSAATIIQRDLQMRVAQVYFQATAYRAGAGQLDLGHGGRIETGMVLAEHPEWVHLDRATGGDDLEESIRRERQFSARDLYRPQTDWREVAPSGWFGDAHAASAEEGNQLLERMVERVLGYLDDVFGTD